MSIYVWEFSRRRVSMTRRDSHNLGYWFLVRRKNESTSPETRGVGGWRIDGSLRNAGKREDFNVTCELARILLPFPFVAPANKHKVTRATPRDQHRTSVSLAGATIISANRQRNITEYAEEANREEDKGQNHAILTFKFPTSRRRASPSRAAHVSRLRSTIGLPLIIKIYDRGRGVTSFIHVPVCTFARLSRNFPRGYAHTDAPPATRRNRRATRRVIK